MRVAQEEVFGPFLTVIPFKDEREAIEIANGVQYGLTGYVWTGEMGRALRVADALEAGMIWLNSENVRHLPTPFGGMNRPASAATAATTRSTSIWKPSTSRSRAGRTRSRNWEFNQHCHCGATLGGEPGMTDHKIEETPMPAPTHVFDPPFNIIRCSHAVLDVTDLDKSAAFYEKTVGLHIEDRDDKSVYLRASEEHQHHSVVLRKAAKAACNRLGFKVGNDGDLDKAAAFCSENGISYAFVEQPFQGRTLQFTDPFGFQIELYATMEKRPHLLRRYDLYKGCHPQRLDHFNVFAAEVQDTVDFYARLGFRLTEYAEEDGDNGRIAAAWMHRKATSTTSPSPTAVVPACTISPIGCRPR